MPHVAVLTAEEARARLRQEMEPDTFAHAERAADLARQLAEIHGVDPDRAELAGLLHDIADRFSERELAILADRYGISVSLTEARVPKLLHAKVGAEILRREWGITDEELLDAVGEHITGGVRMSPLSKVTFVADKLEAGRDRYYGGLDGTREAARVDLDEAILQLYAWRMDDLVRNGRPVDDALVVARNRLIDRMIARRR